MNEWQLNLVAYGSNLLASQLGQSWPPTGEQLSPDSLADEVLRRAGSYEEDKSLQLAREIVYDSSRTQGLRAQAEAKSVAPVFTLLNAPPGVAPRDWKPSPPTALNIPGQETQTDQENNGRVDSVWEKFWKDASRLTVRSKFDTFFYLLARYGWRVSGTVADPLLPNFGNGLSVFEQFKAIAALAHCLDPNSDKNQPICLIAGDLPGIQRVLYTISAKGAAKMLRGHSAYLQLLNDALIRKLLRHFDLCWANVIVNAGGNFLVAAPNRAAREITGLEHTLNKALITLHRGEQYLALASIIIPAHLYADSHPVSEPGSLAEKRMELQQRLEDAKHSAFSNLVTAHYNEIFGPIGDGGPVAAGEKGNLCEVSHIELNEETRRFVPEDETDITGGTLLSEQYHSFAYQSEGDEYDSLAWSIANAKQIFISAVDETPSLDIYAGGKGSPPWNLALQVLGFDYQFIQEGQPAPAKAGTLLAFDPESFLPDTLSNDQSYGFRFLSQSTPRQNHTTKEIRDFHQMAKEDSVGIRRYGVLRMDVDGLGQIVSGQGLLYPDLLHLSALSNALDYFFGRFLDRLGEECVKMWGKQVQEWGYTPAEAIHKQPYVIYAGGDDLFIVASWDILPPLAQKIRDEFSKYCLSRLTMSGGIAIAREKYPLYRAAEQAGLALDRSKDREVIGHEDLLLKARKDALTFLGVTLSWDDVAISWTVTKTLAEMLRGYPDGSKAPRALLQMLNYIARLYQREASASENEPIKLGRWLYALHYGLRRMRRRLPTDELKEKLAALPNQILDLDEVRSAGDRLQQLENVPSDSSHKRQAEISLRRAIRAQLDRSRNDWPAIRYLGVPVRWAEYLTRKED